MKKLNTLLVLIIAMAALIIPAAEAVVLDVRTVSELPPEGIASLGISMACFAVLLYHYLLIPFWTWLKIWLSGR